MNELIDIVRACKAHPRQVMALATVVQTEGSSYRRPGARMLILPDDQTIGSISGGCLEADVIAHAKQVLNTGKCTLLTYDTTSEEDILFGVGLGCKGVVHVLVERIACDDHVAPGDVSLPCFLKGLFQRREKGVVATVIRAEGRTILQVGQRLLLNEDGSVQTDIQDDVLKVGLLADAREALKTNRSTLKSFDSFGTVDIFIEVVHSPASLIVIGAGFDAIPLSRLAKEVGFHLTVVDGRPAYANFDRFPCADAVLIGDPDILSEQLHMDERTSTVIMSHNYLTDCAWLKVLLPMNLRYLGLMGPRKRAEKMLDEIQAAGAAVTGEQIRRVHNPVGLDIGAENPEQIALAILAIQATATGHAGGLLREKKGPIHSPSQPESTAAAPAAALEHLCAV